MSGTKRHCLATLYENFSDFWELYVIIQKLHIVKKCITEFLKDQQ